MAKAQEFHRMLVTEAATADPYWKALAAITRATAAQIGALASDLAWQTWGTESNPSGN